ncbi:MAG: radical SAM protein [Thermoanaerobaculia bacterium]
MSGTPNAVPRVLVAHSYYLKYDAKQTRKMKPYPPLATLITAAILKKAGYEVILFDAMLSEGEEEFERLLEETAPTIVGLLEDNFNFLTKMCTTQMRAAGARMIAAAHAHGCRVAVNGSDATDQPELYLAAGADAVIAGETERTFPELIAAWTSHPAGADDSLLRARLHEIRGLILPPPGGDDTFPPTHTPPRAFVEDLDALPLPAWELVDVERYRRAWTSAHGRLSWNMVTTRGCPYHCNWCAKPLYGVRYAQRAPASVAEELRLLKESVAPEHIWFADDIFGLTPRWIESYGEEVVKRGAMIPFTMQSRADLMKPSAVAALAAAGAEEVWMGVESGSQQILDAMEKGIRIEQVREATRLLREHGIRASWFIQLGYPGEEFGEILETRDLIRAERPDDIGVSVSYPLPGTKFYERVKEQLGAQTNWSDSDDLAMMFEGTYSGPFYRKVRDLLHEEAAPHPESGRAGRLQALDTAWQELAAHQEEYRSARPTPVAVLSDSGAHPLVAG